MSNTLLPGVFSGGGGGGGGGMPQSHDMTDERTQTQRSERRIIQ